MRVSKSVMARQKESSATIRAMQATQDISQLALMHQQIEEAAKDWQDDAYIRSLASQASLRVEEARTHKRQILEELTEIEGSLGGARSLGQLQLMEQQARVLASDFPSDKDVEDAIRRMGQVAQVKFQLVNSTCSELKELTSRIAKAQTLEEAEDLAREAEQVASDETNFEEIEDSIRKVQQLIGERKKEYIRIERNLQLLIENSVKATGPAELELILARRRDLVKKYSGEVSFLKLHERLEASVNERRLQLAELTASEYETESPSEASEHGTGNTDYAYASESGKTQVELSQRLEAASSHAERPRRRRFPLSLTLLAGGLLATAFAALFFVSKTARIRIDPPTAKIQLDGWICDSPCSRRLMPGRHELVATLPGFDEIRQIVIVSWGVGDLPVLTLRLTPETATAIEPKSTTGGGSWFKRMSKEPMFWLTVSWLA